MLKASSYIHINLQKKCLYIGGVIIKLFLQKRVLKDYFQQGIARIINPFSRNFWAKIMNVSFANLTKGEVQIRS